MRVLAQRNGAVSRRSYCRKARKMRGHWKARNDWLGNADDAQSFCFLVECGKAGSMADGSLSQSRRGRADAFRRSEYFDKLSIDVVHHSAAVGGKLITGVQS